MSTQTGSTNPATTIAEGTETKFRGRAMLRKEDDRLLRAEGEFVDDTPHHRLGYIQFVRSPYAHARIVDIDTSAAEQVEGFIGLMTPDDLAEVTDPFIEYQSGHGAPEVDRALAADGKARYVGEPVVVVAGETREAAKDVADAVRVTYEQLPHVTVTEETVAEGAPVLHEGIGDNICWEGLFDFGDIDFALEHADHVIEVDRLHFHRFSPTPMETNVITAVYDPGIDTFYLDGGFAQPQLALLTIASALRMPSERIRLQSKDFGGSFGVKVSAGISAVAVAAMARKFRRTMRFTQTRTEGQYEGGHSNERTFLNCKIAVQNDGTVLGLSYDALDDIGAYSRYEPLGAPIWSQVANASYHYKHLRVNYKTVYTNKGPTAPVRGYSRMQHIWAVERLFDIAAHTSRDNPRSHWVAAMRHGSRATQRRTSTIRTQPGRLVRATDRGSGPRVSTDRPAPGGRGKQVVPMPNTTTTITGSAPESGWGAGARPGGPAVGPYRTMAESVAAEIHRLILTGVYAPGEALRIQDLAERFQTSSMPVREALRQLSATGIVDVAPHRGARVARISVEDLDDTFAVRLALEPMATRLAAEKMTEAQLAEASDAFDRYLALLDAGEVDTARRAHAEFHFAIYHAAGSRWLLRAIDPVWQNTERYRFGWGENGAEQRKRAHTEHLHILEACRAGDVDAAGAAMQDHLDGAHRRIRAAILHLEEDGSGA